MFNNKYYTSMFSKWKMSNICDLTLDQIGFCLFYIYIFLSYMCNDLIFPSVINSIALYAFIVYSIIYIICNGKIRICVIVPWMCLFIIYSLVSMLYSPEKHIFSGQFYLLIVNFVIVLLLSQYRISLKEIQTAGWLYSFSGAMLIIILILGGNIHDLSDSGRLGTELLGNANILASMLMISALYTLWLLVYQSEKKYYKLLLLLFLFTQYYGMFLSGGRKYIIVPILFLFVLLIFKRDSDGKNHKIKYIFFILILILVLFTLIFYLPALYNSIGVRFEEFFAFFNGDLNKADSSTIVRAQMINMGLSRWLCNPIWGYGFDSFKYYNASITGHFYYSHNNFIEMLYNGGIIGFCIYYSFYLYVLLLSIRHCNELNRSFAALTVASVISMLVYEITAINYTSTQFMILMCMACIVNRKIIYNSNRNFVRPT